jgi:hypothetical protein
MERDDIISFLRGASDLISHACRDLTEAQLIELLRPGPAVSLLGWPATCGIRPSRKAFGPGAWSGGQPHARAVRRSSACDRTTLPGGRSAKVMTALRAYFTGYAYQAGTVHGCGMGARRHAPGDGSVTVRSRGVEWSTPRRTSRRCRPLGKRPSARRRPEASCNQRTS